MIPNKETLQPQRVIPTVHSHGFPIIRNTTGILRTVSVRHYTVQAPNKLEDKDTSDDYRGPKKKEKDILEEFDKEVKLDELNDNTGETNAEENPSEGQEEQAETQETFETGPMHLVITPDMVDNLPSKIIEEFKKEGARVVFSVPLDNKSYKFTFHVTQPKASLSSEQFMHMFIKSSPKKALAEFFSSYLGKRYEVDFQHLRAALRILSILYPRPMQLGNLEAFTLYIAQIATKLQNHESTNGQQFWQLCLKIALERHFRLSSLRTLLDTVQEANIASSSGQRITAMLMECWARLLETKKVIELFAIMKKKNLRPTPYHYASVFYCFRKKGEFDRAIKIMNELDNVGYVFQYPMTCHLLYICAYKGLVDRVVYLLRNSAETQTFLYKEEIEDTIQGFVDAKNLKGAMEAEAVIERCNPKHLTLLWVWKTLFFLSMELNKGDQSSRYFRKMIALLKSQVLSQTEEDKLREIMTRLRERAIVTFFEKGMLREMTEFYRHWRIDPSDYQNVLTVLKRCLRHLSMIDDTKNKASFLMKLISDIRPDLLSHSTAAVEVLLQLAAAAHYADEVEHLFKELLKRGVVPSVDSCNAIIKMRASLNNYQGMQDMFEEMQQNGIAPNTETYNFVMSAYARQAKWDRVEKLAEEMEKDKVPRNLNTWACLIEAQFFKDKYAEAISLFKQATEGAMEELFTALAGNTRIPQKKYYNLQSWLTSDLIGRLMTACRKAKDVEMATKLFEAHKHFVGSTEKIATVCWVEILGILSENKHSGFKEYLKSFAEVLPTLNITYAQASTLITLMTGNLQGPSTTMPKNSDEQLNPAEKEYLQKHLNQLVQAL